MVNKGRVQISKDLLVRKKKKKGKKQITFESDKQKYLLPKLNLPLDLKTENTMQSTSEHPIKDVIVLQAGKSTFLTFLSKIHKTLETSFAASNLSCILNKTQRFL